MMMLMAMEASTNGGEGHNESIPATTMEGVTLLAQGAEAVRSSKLSSTLVLQHGTSEEDEACVDA